MGQLSVAVLGASQVRHGGAALTFATRKAVALIVYLTVEGGLHARDKLAILLWPNSDRSHARAMLRYTLSDLRHTLRDSTAGPHVIVQREFLGVDLDSDLDLDITPLRATGALSRSGTLTELREAIRRWRGEFLDGFSVSDSPDFEAWISVQRELWRQHIERLLDRLSQMEIDGGEFAEAMASVQRWLTVNPLNEEAHRRVMRLHLRTGDRTAALRAYEACRHLLDAELHVAPAPETEALTDRIRASAPAARTLGATMPPTGLFEGPFVGRKVQFAELAELYVSATHGQAQVVVLHGEPGIGKSRLAREFANWLTSSHVDVLRGRAFATGGRLPYQPLVDALRPRLERENAPEDLLSDVWLVELGRLLPELRERYPDLPAPSVEEAPARLRLFEAIARLGQALAQKGPMVLLLDDMQWADVGSLDALQYTARRWSDERAPVLVLLSVRSEVLADNSALRDWLAGTHTAVAVRQIELGPLTAMDTLDYTQRVTVGSDQSQIDALARWLFAETAGQPLFLEESFRALLEREALVPRARADGSWVIDLPAGLVDELDSDTPLPPAVRDVISTRLARLGPSARDLLAAGSVLGQGFTFSQACKVASLDEGEALLAVDEVLRAHVVREATTSDSSPARGYVFGHDKIRDVVYADAGDGRRRVLHRRAFEALEGVAQAAHLAHHALAAGLDAAALRYLRAAGDEAVRLLAARDAIVHYTHALEVAERLGSRAEAAELHARCGKALARVGRWTDARRELEASLAGPGYGNAEQRADVLGDLLEACFWSLDLPSVWQRSAELAELAQELHRPELHAGANSWLATTIAADGDMARSIAQAEHWFARGRELGVAPLPPVHAYMPIVSYWLGRIEEAVERSHESVRAARRASHASATMLALPNLGLALAASGRYIEAERAFDEARRFGHEHGVGTLLARGIAMSAGYHLDVFDYVGNEEIAYEARELARSLNFPPPAISAGIDLMLNFARREEVGRAEQLIEEVSKVASKATAWHGWLWRIRLDQARAEIAVARHDWNAALEWTARVIDESGRRGRAKYEVLGLCTRAVALRGLGRAREAIEVLRTAVPLARRIGDLSVFLRAAALLLEIEGDGTLAIEAAATTARIVGEMPNARMRSCFEAGVPRALLTVTSSG
jgi:DNA-binding SARP family transcriptional activator/tetratricopeptide (TPR) repeat protein